MLTVTSKAHQFLVFFYFTENRYGRERPHQFERVQGACGFDGAEHVLSAVIGGHGRNGVAATCRGRCRCVRERRRKRFTTLAYACPRYFGTFGVQ